MVFDRRQRRGLSAWLFVVLLFTQFATAAYACPWIGADLHHTPAVDAGFAAAMAEMPGCDGNMSESMDPDQPQLCKAHCEQGSQSVNPTSSATSPSDLPAPPLLAVLDWRPAAVAPLPAGRAATQTPPGASPPGSPPLYLSLLVLRN